MLLCLAPQRSLMPASSCMTSHWAHGVVVSHPLSMREALGSIPSVSIFAAGGPSAGTAAARRGLVHGATCRAKASLAPRRLAPPRQTQGRGTRAGTTGNWAAGHGCRLGRPGLRAPAAKPARLPLPLCLASERASGRAGRASATSATCTRPLQARGWPARRARPHLSAGDGGVARDSATM